jgi:hypothetical protein
MVEVDIAGVDDSRPVRQKNRTGEGCGWFSFVEKFSSSRYRNQSTLRPDPVAAGKNNGDGFGDE